MEKLIRVIRDIQQKLPSVKRRQLKETPTRVIIIDPLLEALGWDVRDPSEVELEYSTVAGKSVDYALKLNNKPVLLIEAKALGDTLDEKAVSQIVSYAANNGIDWCILTDGILWRVYRSMEKCPAPQKLMFEVNIDPQEAEATSVEQIAQAMWRFSREEMARGSLDALGEKIFTDNKVRKAVKELITNPPRRLLHLVREAAHDETLSFPQLRDSLLRLAEELTTLEWGPGVMAPLREKVPDRQVRSTALHKAGQIRRTSTESTPYNENHHLQGKPQEVVALYRALERLCLSMEPSAVTRHFWAHYISFKYADRGFCDVLLQHRSLRVWLRLKYDALENPPEFARDVAHIGHLGSGEVELRISNQSELETGAKFIRQSFEAVKNR